jgi:5-methylcytosine-specific restriction endonuclease McrA/DNA-binding CsgD family transcriptional regulator
MPTLLWRQSRRARSTREEGSGLISSQHLSEADLEHMRVHCTEAQLSAIKLWNAGYGYKRIGRMLGIHPSTAQARIRDGLKRVGLDIDTVRAVGSEQLAGRASMLQEQRRIVREQLSQAIREGRAPRTWIGPELESDVPHWPRLSRDEAIKQFFDRIEAHAKRKKEQPFRRRQRFFAMFDPNCYLCGAGLTIKSFQVEHIIPLAQGGTNERANLAIACGSCNLGKSDSIVAFDVATRSPFFVRCPS